MGYSKYRVCTQDQEHDFIRTLWSERINLIGDILGSSEPFAVIGSFNEDNIVEYIVFTKETGKQLKDVSNSTALLYYNTVNNVSSMNNKTLDYVKDCVMHNKDIDSNKVESLNNKFSLTGLYGDSSTSPFSGVSHGFSSNAVSLFKTNTEELSEQDIDIAIDEVANLCNLGDIFGDTDVTPAKFGAPVPDYTSELTDTDMRLILSDNEDLELIRDILDINTLDFKYKRYFIEEDRGFTNLITDFNDKYNFIVLYTDNSYNLFSNSINNYSVDYILVCKNKHLVNILASEDYNLAQIDAIINNRISKTADNFNVFTSVSSLMRQIYKDGKHKANVKVTMETKGFTTNNALHSLGVAKRCKEISEQLHMTEDEQLTCWLMGYIHDIGKEFTKSNIDHERASIYLLNLLSNNYSECGKQIVDAIYTHGNLKCNLDNKFVYILNKADSEVDASGNFVGYTGRLDDIQLRYSLTSDEFINMSWMIEKITKKDKEYNIKH